MPRYLLAILAVLTLAAPPALGQAIQIEGSVQPAAPTGFPVVGDADENEDGVIDFISTGGNGIITTGISQTDPTGEAGNGLPWDAARIYRNYESPQNILVGDRQQSGRLAISAGGTLRYQHLVLGGVLDTSDVRSPLETVVNPTQVTNLVGDYIGAVPAGTGGSGSMTISGLGSLFSNDPNLIDQTVQTALNLADGSTGTITELADNIDETNWPFNGTPGDSFRDFGAATGGYDVVVGLNGNGSLDITAGGRMEVQDALMIGVDSQSNGTVTVDGVGSTLSAFGRNRLSGGFALTPFPSGEATSFVGGRGTGLLTVSGGGRAEFFNGLSIGAPTGTLDGIRATAAGDGSGNVTVTGSGSLLTATASSINNFGNDNLALAIGEIRSDDLSTTAFDPNLQSGRLEINDNAVVSTGTGIAEFGGNPGNAAIGKRGEVNLGGGIFQVGDNLDNDGVISGYGDVRADTLETSVFSVIRGGNPNSENPELADPLRLVLLDNTDTALTNRGLIEGRVNFDVSGTIVNEGQIETSGEIFANELFTSVESRIRQAPGTDSPLRLRLNQERAAGDSGDGTNFGALHNRGEIEGELDFIVAGGVVNGDNNLPFGTGTDLPSSGSASTGSITGSGRILAGTFINHDDGEVRVAAGESLSLLANGSADTDFVAGDGIPTSGGGDVGYRVMNLGSMSVSGGSLEVGYLNDTSPDPVSFLTGPTTFNTSEVFYNARYVVEDGLGAVTERTAGTITVNDGELRLTTGMLNAGVLAFTGGDNLVHGKIYNTSLDYSNGGPPLVENGVILVSGDGTTVTFEDDVINDGEIFVGSFDNVANFLGDLTNNGTISVAFNLAGGASRGAVITVAGGVQINGGTIDIGFLSAPDTLDTDVSIALLTADTLSEESLFTELVLPDLADGQFWDIVYDTDNDEVRLEIVESNAFGADFTGDGIVSQDDVDVWIRNAGIVAGASTIQGDADLDGDVDLADYDVLMAQLFTGIPEVVSTGLALVTGAVPEPTTALLLCLAVVTSGAARRR